MEFKIAAFPGDGVGPEVVDEGINVLRKIGLATADTFAIEHGSVGGISIDQVGVPLPKRSLDIAKGSDAVLFGAVGGPKWDDPRAPHRPEDAILGLRKSLGLFANIRPVKIVPSLVDSSPIKASLLKGVDIVMIRELTGGLYFATPKKRWDTARGRRGVDTLRYTEQEIARVLRVGFGIARRRKKLLTSVDKANVLESSRLWREIANEVSSEYPDVTLEHALVDSCAMSLISNPSHFDVIVAENMFGDILTDEAAVLSGSLGMLPSASLAGIPRDNAGGRRTMGLYEPIHGTAPDIAGQSKANPIAMILSVAFMLRYSLGLAESGQIVEQAVDKVLEEGYRTADIAAEDTKEIVNTSQMGDLIVDALVL